MCIEAYVALSLTSLGLLISVCLNITLYLLRRKERQKEAKNIFEYEEEPFHQDSNQSYRFEDDEVERQENPIYGNIGLDGGASYGMSENMCYEQMSQPSTLKQGLKVHHGDVSYASLDLRGNKKRRKKRKYQKQGQTYQAQTHSQHDGQENSMEQEHEAEVTLPSRTSSLMVSRHSIYLNSHQVALEAEERGREREREREREMEREREDSEEREFEMRRNVHESFDLSLGRSRQSLEQES